LINTFGGVLLTEFGVGTSEAIKGGDIIGFKIQDFQISFDRQFPVI